MQTMLKVCKLYLLLCLGLSTNASPILNGLKTTSSEYQQSDFSHQESQFASNLNFGNMETKFNLQSGSAVDQSLKNTPGITTTYRDQNGNLVTQVKKETYNKENGLSSRAFEIQESKKLPNGYSNSFQKEYSSSSVIGSQPTTFVQKPLNAEKYYNSEQISNAESSLYGQSFQNYQGQSIPANRGNLGIKSNIKSTVDQSLTNVPGVTSTFRDQNGNIVTQVKKEIITNNDGQNGHVVEFEEIKQLPNGYSKSFKKEYSSSSVIGSQPTTFVQKPLNVEKYYNSEQISNAESSLYGQSFQNYQGQSIPTNAGNLGIKSNFKSTVDQSLTNVPGVTSTFRDQNGNIVTQVKKEIITNNDGQNGHVVEFEETKQLPNGYSKSFKKEYSSSSVIGSQPTTFVQKPLNVEKYYNSEQISNAESSLYGQSFQNYQGQSIPTNAGNLGIKSNFKSTVDQSLTNVPGVTSTFRDQNGNIVTQVKKEIVTNNDGQNGHVLEFEETKQLPNGYSKSFKKEYLSSSVVSAHPTLIKDTNTEKNTYLPQQMTQGDAEKFNGYNTFFNNQKYTFNQTSPISSQVYNNKKQLETTSPLVGNSFSQNTKDQINCDERCSISFTNQGFKQQTLNSNLSSIGQLPVNTDHILTSKQPSSQKFEKVESFSTQTHEEVGQQSVDLHGYSKPSQIGQMSVDISNLNIPKTPSSQKFEKVESFSTQTQEEVGQQSVDLHTYSKPSQIGQQSVDISNLYVPKKPIGQQFEKIESFSTQTQEEVGQQTVDLHGYSKPSKIGQQSADNTNLYAPKKPSSKKFEKVESFSTQTQEEVGQQSVDLHGYSKPSQIGQQSVDISNLYVPKKPIGQQFEKIESFSTQTQEEVGQQSVDLHGYSKPPQIGQMSVDISNLNIPKTPSSQKFEKIESFSTQTQEEVGQQSVDLHGYSKPFQLGQQSVDNTNLYAPKKPSSKKFEKVESFSTQTQEEVGQQSVDLHTYSKPSQIGQQSVDISNLYEPKKPIGQQFEKIESFSTQTQEVGQQSVDLHEYSKPSKIGQQSVDNIDLYAPKKPSSKKFEKVESFSTQTQEEVGQQSVDLHGYSKPSQIGQQSVDISNLYVPNKPIGQQFEKIESFSTQTQEEVGQQSVDLHGYSKPPQIGQMSVDISNLNIPKTPSSQKFEKIESFSTQTQEEVGQQSVDLHGYSKPFQSGQQSVGISNLYVPNKPIGNQFEKSESYQNKLNLIGQQPVNFKTNEKLSQQIFSQPISGQQIQGSEFFKSNYGGTSQLLDLGALGQPTEYIRTSGQQNMNNNKYIGQQSIGVFESQSTIEKNINLSSADQLQTNVDGNQGNVYTNYQTYQDQSMKNSAFTGHQSIDYTSDVEGHKPTFKKQHGNIDFQSSKLPSQTGQLSTGNNGPINSKYNSVFDKLDQLEHEVLGAKSSTNINKGNVQTAYSINHNVKSMPLQTSQQESHFSKTTNENTQYIEPESDFVYSKSLKTDSKLVVQDKIENQTSNNDNFSENLTTPSSVWKKIGDKFKGTIENAKNKAQQLASNINDKVGFSSITGNPC
ncbi:hypothetical protein ACI65C_008021 [Semiaphis heraclei]